MAMVIPSYASAAVAAVNVAVREVTKVNVRLLENGALGQAQELMGLLQDLKRVEDRFHQLVGDEATPSVATSAPPASPGLAEESDAASFVRRGTAIVKIGQRRGGTGTYEQRMPRSQFDQVAGVLIDLSTTATEFEAKRPIDRVNVPAYQVYMVLGILERQGLMKTPSRGRYSFPRPLAPADFDAVWSRVPDEKR